MKEIKIGCGRKRTLRGFGLMLCICFGMLALPAFTSHAADGQAVFSEKYAKPGTILKALPEEDLPEGCIYQYQWSVGGKDAGNFTDSYQVKDTDLEKMIQVKIRVTGAVQNSYTGQMYCSELPVMYVTTEKAITGKTEYVDGTLSTQMNDEYQDATGYEGKIQIRWRGNSTMGLPKKPYKVKLDKKTDMFGFGKNKHWVLLANYLDNSFMKNSLSYNLSGDLGMPYMQSVNVVLIMDGNYQGLYQFCEQIRVDQDSGGNRVDIYDWESAAEDHAKAIAEAEGFSKTDKKALEEAMAADYAWASTGQVLYGGKTYQLGDYEDIEIPSRTGGYLIELDEYFDELSKFISWQMKQPLNLKNPEMAYTNEEMMNYAATYIDAFETAIQNADFTAWHEGENKSYSQLFDMGSLVDFWLVNELFMNEDAMKKSTYMYKDIDGLFFMGPIWDMDWAAAGEGNTHNPKVWQTLYYNSNAQANQWYKKMIKDPYFAAMAYERYHEIRDTLLEEMVQDEGTIDQNQIYMQKAAQADYDLWRRGSGFQEEVSRLRGFLRERISWMDQQFQSVETLMTSFRTNKLVENAVTIHAETKDENVIQFMMPGQAEKAQVRINGNYLGAASIENGKARMEFDDTYVLTDGSQNLITINYEGKDGAVTYSYASFIKKLSQLYKVTVTAGKGGAAGIVTQDGLAGELTAEQETWITVLAEPSKDYQFEAWIENGEVISKEAEYQFSLDANRTLEASFTKMQEPPKPDEYQVTVSASEGGNAGVVIGSGLVGNWSAEEGTQLTLRAQVAPNYVFDGWYEDGIKVAGTTDYMFLLRGSRSLTARFIKSEKPVDPEKKKLDTLQITKIKDRAYTGKAVKPSVHVQDGAAILKQGQDYTAAYKKNKNPGKASVILTGAGNYTGTKTIHFNIVPKKAEKPRTLLAKKRMVTVLWKRDKRATGYQIQYSLSKNFKKGNKEVLVKKNSVKSKKIGKLKAGRKYYVRIRAYKLISGKKAYGAYSKARSVRV